MSADRAAPIGPDTQADPVGAATRDQRGREMDTVTASVVPAHAIDAAARKLASQTLNDGNAWDSMDAEDRASCVELATATVLAALEAIDPALLISEHQVRITDEAWAMQHPLSCRPNLLDCEVHKVWAGAGEALALEVDDGTYPTEIVEDEYLKVRVGDQVLDVDEIAGGLWLD